MEPQPDYSVKPNHALIEDDLFEKNLDTLIKYVKLKISWLEAIKEKEKEEFLQKANNVFQKIENSM